MLSNDPVFKFVNYHLRVFVKRYCHLRVFFKIFPLTLRCPDWTPLSGHNGSTPPGLWVLKEISQRKDTFQFTYNQYLSLNSQFLLSAFPLFWLTNGQDDEAHLEDSYRADSSFPLGTIEKSGFTS